MMYKVLLTGNNRTVINEFFTYLDSCFECMSTSDRYDDIVNHMKYARPDVFVYCLFKERPDDLKRFSNIERQITSRNIPLVIVGDFNDCNEFSKMVPQIDPLVLQKPISIQNIAVAIIDLLKKCRKQEELHAEETAPGSGAGQGTKGASSSGAGGAASAMGVQKKAVPGAGEAPVLRANGASAAGMNGAAQTGASGAAKAGGAAAAGADVRQTTAGTQRATAAGTGGAAAPAAGGAASLEEPTQERRRRKHILVVDDDSRVLRMLKGYLAERYELATAINGRVALKFLETKETDLVLLDYEMPEENGAAVLEKIRANEKTKGLPVVFLTGVTEGNKIKEVLALKPQGYLLKPVDMEKVSSTIKGILG